MNTTAAARMALGRHGEDIAARYLLDLGLILLDRNWRCNEGELDLVLRDGSTLVACEVKTRSGAVGGSPHEAVTRVKLDRLLRLAQRWVNDHGLNVNDVRVDVVAVMRPPKGPALVEHVRGLV